MGAEKLPAGVLVLSSDVKVAHPGHTAGSRKLSTSFIEKGQEARGCGDGAAG